MLSYQLILLSSNYIDNITAIDNLNENINSKNTY